MLLPNGCRFDIYEVIDISILLNLFIRTVVLRLTQPLTEGIFLGGKARPAREAGNLTAVCEPIF
jgi:hypothetical protein